MNDEPLAFFITWTVYGTQLQGDELGWRKIGEGDRLPAPLLADWHRERLNHEIKLLDEQTRSIVEHEIRRCCQLREWKLWAVNARTTHVHVVVTAGGYDGAKVRDYLKANCTRVLREHFPNDFCDRMVWTRGGDWKCINKEDDLEAVIQYVTEAQDRQ